MTRTLSRRHALGTLAALLAPAALRAQAAWPTKPLRFVVPYPAGGTPDGFTRQVCDQLGKQLGAVAIVDNKPGASGLLGMRAVSMGAADQHTFAHVTSGQITLSAMNPKFDITRELKPACR